MHGDPPGHVAKPWVVVAEYRGSRAGDWWVVHRISEKMFIRSDAETLGGRG